MRLQLGAQHPPHELAPVAAHGTKRQHRVRRGEHPRPLRRPCLCRPRTRPAGIRTPHWSRRPPAATLQHVLPQQQRGRAHRATKLDEQRVCDLRPMTGTAHAAGRENNGDGVNELCRVGARAPRVTSSVVNWGSRVAHAQRRGAVSRPTHQRIHTTRPRASTSSIGARCVTGGCTTGEQAPARCWEGVGAAAASLQLSIARRMAQSQPALDPASGAPDSAEDAGVVGVARHASCVKRHQLRSKYKGQQYSVILTSLAV
jgi:hypothetical protein